MVRKDHRPDVGAVQEQAVIAAVVGQDVDKEALVRELQSESGCEVKFLASNASFDQPEAPEFSRPNMPPAKKAFWLSVLLAILCTLAYMLYRYSVHGWGVWDAAIVMVSILLAFLTAIMSGIIGAPFVPSKRYERLFENLSPGEAVIAAKCASQEHARSVVAGLQGKGLSRIRVITPEAMV